MESEKNGQMDKKWTNIILAGEQTALCKEFTQLQPVFFLGEQTGIHGYHLKTNENTYPTSVHMIGFSETIWELYQKLIFGLELKKILNSPKRTSFEDDKIY